jgi:nicotinamide-nucleotide amidase
MPDEHRSDDEADGSEPEDVAARRLGDILADTDRTIAVAESLTGGLLVQALARVEGSGEWLRGGVVAYHRGVKHELLGVTDEIVVSAQAASEMASGVRRVLGADVGVAVTGVAGPDPQDGRPPGTVFVAVDCGDGPRSSELSLSGEPGDICTDTVSAALRMAAGAASG